MGNNKNDVEYLKQYLKDVYTLEKEIYRSQKANESLHELINKAESARKVTVRTNNTSVFGSILYGIIKGGIMGLIAGAIIGAGIGSMMNNRMIFVVILVICTAAGAIFFGWGEKAGAEVQNNRRSREQRQAEEENRRIDRERALVPTYKNNINVYEQNISKCKATLNRMYSLNVIFPKYRNFVAVAQMYEYFVAGRCTTLEGHEGAYNLFESELRQNVIILKLNEVISNLEEIKETQYMIYSAIKEGNALLGEIASSSRATAHNTKVIADLTAMQTRYNYY